MHYTKEIMNGNEANSYIVNQTNSIPTPFVSYISMLKRCVNRWIEQGIKSTHGFFSWVNELQSSVKNRNNKSSQFGVLPTTFTASPRLLLMIPNMYVEECYCDMSTSSYATHALSVYRIKKRLKQLKILKHYNVLFNSKG